MATIEVLKSSQLFKDLSPSQLEKIAAICKEKTYPAGKTVLKEGDEVKEFCLLLEGKVLLEMDVKVDVRRPAIKTAVDSVAPGQSFAWSALVEPHISNFSASCLDPSKVLAIDGAKLQQLFAKDTDMGYKVMSKLAALIANRLAHTRQTLTSERGLATLYQEYSY